MAMPLLFCLLVDINLLSLTLQQSLLPSKGSDDTSNVMPMVNQLANNSMSIAWIKIQDEMKIYMENLTSRLDELSEKASELRTALDYPFVLSGPKKTCPTDYLLHGRFCYLFHPRPVPWFVAMVTCLGINAMLARPDTPEKDRFLEEQCLRTGQSHWVGATDMEMEGVWRWTNNHDRITFSNWGTGQPNDWGHGEDCLAVGSRSTGLPVWNDHLCMDRKPFICERPAISN